MINNKKIIRYERHFEDGTSDFVDGEFLDNFLTNLSIADGFAVTRSYIQYKPVEWTVNTPERKIQIAINDLRNELDQRVRAYVIAYNTIKEDDGEEDQIISEEDVEEKVHGDALDLCELYHQIRKGNDE